MNKKCETALDADVPESYNVRHEDNNKETTAMKISDIGFVYSEHYRDDNDGRESAISEIGGDGNVIAMFYVDRGHRNGPEKHYLTDNGIIIIVNAITNVLCTKLIARPHQLLRYREWGLKNELNETTRKMKNWLVPQWLIAKAVSHQKAGLNHT